MYRKVEIDCFVKKIKEGSDLQIEIKNESTPEGSECSVFIVSGTINKLVLCEYGDKKKKTIKLSLGFRNTLVATKVEKGIINAAYEKCAV